MNEILKVENLTKIFFEKKYFLKKDKPFVAVDNISFSLHTGEILGFLGPNGAGKTTTIQMLLGLMSPTSGKIEYFSKNFEQNKSEILQNVSYASAYTQLAPRLTIYENLDFFAEICGLSPEQRTKQIEKSLKFFGIWNIKSRLTGKLSAGQTTRVILAKAFLTDPKIVLLDEPTASLDPDIAQDVRNFILEQRKEKNISVLFTSHNMAEVEELCNRIIILKNGKIIEDNTTEQIATKISQANLNLMLDDENRIKIKR